MADSAAYNVTSFILLLRLISVSVELTNIIVIPINVRMERASREVMRAMPSCSRVLLRKHLKRKGRKELELTPSPTLEERLLEGRVRGSCPFEAAMET